MRNTASANRDFICVNCHHYVSAVQIVAGVNNRNHCPYCLWSRHVDWLEAGDRLSACKSGMRPVGLTLKRIHKRYARNSRGELMLIHCCTDCGEVSINRIAADDDSSVLLSAYERSLKLDRRLLGELQRRGIDLLNRSAAQLVRSQLFGCQLPLREMAL